MLKFRVVSIALVALLSLAAVSQAADKADKKKKGNGAAGTVKAIDASAKSITITVKNKKETEDKTFTVADDAKVTLDGEKKSLSDLEVGAKVRVKLSEDGKTVTAINVGMKKKKKDA